MVPGCASSTACARAAILRLDLNFKDERALWERLLNATTLEEVKAVCDESPFWLNPKRGATMFHDLLSGNTEGFLAAMQDRRWPKSNRPTSQGRRIRFLARSMAGITMGIGIRTAQDLLAKTEQEKLEATGPCASAAIVNGIIRIGAAVSIAFAPTMNIPAEES